MKTEPQDLVLPIVHPNGTSKAELLEQRNAVYDALQFADALLARMAPNGRDYYPEPGWMDRAVAQHRSRQDLLRQLIDGLEAEIIAIDRLP